MAGSYNGQNDNVNVVFNDIVPFGVPKLMAIFMLEYGNNGW